jgi:lipoprotein-releasing system ATP-binding protein
MLPMQRLGELPPGAMEERAKSLLHDLGLNGEAKKLPHQLSGGQSARVAIARALANDPLMVLADEPTGNLDTRAGANVQRIMKDLAHVHGRTVIVVTHDREFAASADHAITIVDGRIQ